MNPIHHLFFDTPFGVAAVTFSDPPFRLHEVCLPRRTRKDVLARMKRPAAGSEASHPLAADIGAMVQRYFDGQRCTIPWDLMATDHWTPAQHLVYQAVAQIPFGEVRSYGQIARQAGRPKAARFVGNCMASNPFPVLVPCHRVIASDGRLGGFGGGLPLKQKMLQLEGLDSETMMLRQGCGAVPATWG